MGFLDDVNEVEKKTEATKATTYEYTVSRVKEVTDTMVSFTLTVNGVSIYGMKMIKCTSKKTGETFLTVAFPSQPNKDKTKYFDVCSFPMTLAIREDIIKKVTEALKNNK